MIITGDLHANATNELDYLNPNYLKERYGDNCKDTFIIILGDGGFLWHNDPYSARGGELISTLEEWCEELGNKIICLPGNHENYKAIYDKTITPKVICNIPIYGNLSTCHEGIKLSGTFRQISKNILYTERYGEYIIENKTILVLGGALSLDRAIRHEGEWFIDETFSVEDKDKIISIIRDGWYDYVFSHTCPDIILRRIYSDRIFRDGNSEFFSKVMNYISPKKWYFGHLHPSKINDTEYNYGNFNNLKLEDTEFKCLFKEIQEIL